MSNHNYPPQSKQSCKNCYYSLLVETPNRILGVCRKNAPRPTVGESRYPSWPIVGSDNWCGEWAPQEASR